MAICNFEILVKQVIKRYYPAFLCLVKYYNDLKQCIHSLFPEFHWNKTVVLKRKWIINFPIAGYLELDNEDNTKLIDKV